MLCCENFGIKALMKLNIENSINILAFKLNEIDLRTWKLKLSNSQSPIFFILFGKTKLISKLLQIWYLFYVVPDLACGIQRSSSSEILNFF